MKNLVPIAGGVVVAAILAVGAWAHEGEHKEGEAGKKVTLTGELIDTSCFVTSDGDAKGKDHAQCATKCLKSGIPAGILPEGAKDPHALRFLLTNPAVLAPYAAQTIKVEGKEFEQMHAIDPAKIFVKEGDTWKEVQLKDEHHKTNEPGGKTDQGAKQQHEGHEGGAHPGSAHPSGHNH